MRILFTSFCVCLALLTTFNSANAKDLISEICGEDRATFVKNTECLEQSKIFRIDLSQIEKFSTNEILIEREILKQKDSLTDFIPFVDRNNQINYAQSSIRYACLATAYMYLVYQADHSLEVEKNIISLARDCPKLRIRHPYICLQSVIERFSYDFQKFTAKQNQGENEFFIYSVLSGVYGLFIHEYAHIELNHIVKNKGGEYFTAEDEFEADLFSFFKLAGNGFVPSASYYLFEFISLIAQGMEYDIDSSYYQPMKCRRLNIEFLTVQVSTTHRLALQIITNGFYDPIFESPQHPDSINSTQIEEALEQVLKPHELQYAPDCKTIFTGRMSRVKSDMDVLLDLVNEHKYEFGYTDYDLETPQRFPSFISFPTGFLEEFLDEEKWNWENRSTLNFIADLMATIAKRAAQSPNSVTRDFLKYQSKITKYIEKYGDNGAKAKLSNALGHLARRAGDMDDATKHFKDSYSLANNDFDTLLNLVNWSAIASDCNLTLKYLDNAIRMAPTVGLFMTLESQKETVINSKSEVTNCGLEL